MRKKAPPPKYVFDGTDYEMDDLDYVHDPNTAGYSSDEDCTYAEFKKRRQIIEEVKQELREELKEQLLYELKEQVKQELREELKAEFARLTAELGHYVQTTIAGMRWRQIQVQRKE